MPVVFCSSPREYPGGRSFPCHQCAVCLEMRRVELVTRARVEMSQFKCTAFATATYAPAFYPAGRAALLRDYRRLYLFLKSSGVRSLIVGERGEQRGRVHFHLLGMNLEPLEFEALLARHWHERNRGFVNVPLDPARSAVYLGKYVYKGVHGRAAEALHPDGFGVMPCYYLRGPALGCSVIPKLAAQIAADPAKRLHEVATGDVEDHLQFGPKRVRMPRAIKTRLREARGIPSRSAVRDEFGYYCRQVERRRPDVMRRRSGRRDVLVQRLEHLAATSEARRLHLDPGYRAAVAELKRREELGLPIPGRRKRSSGDADHSVRWCSDQKRVGAAGAFFDGSSRIRDCGPGVDPSDPLSGVWRGESA